MPTPAPPLSELLAAKLQAIGLTIRAQRKRLGVSAATAAEAAGMSRVTLHRLEAGSPSVTIGAYLGALHAVGLDLELIEAGAPRQSEPQTEFPEQVSLAAYPQLRGLAWQRPGDQQIEPRVALELYERNWRHVDVKALEPKERALILALQKKFGGPRLV